MCIEKNIRIAGTPKGRAVTIRANGKKVAAHEGESVLAALTAAGITALSDAPPDLCAGALCGMGICYQCRVTIDGVPDRRACMAEVREGMEILTCQSGRRSDA